MNNTVFAPVLIPTLNRFEHFKRCLESLEKCTGADKTDVYVGLDYPPSEKYIKGWKKIDAFLTDKEKKNGFKNLYVRRRDHNCGVCNPRSNSALLRMEIQDKVEYYISTEDDNEFSPNFLVYMNTMLEKFKDDDRIYRVCGYNKNVTIPDYYKNNYYIARQFVAWGIGNWIHKKLPERYRSWDFLKSIIINDDTYQVLKARGPAFTEGLMSMLKFGHLWGDMQVALYETLEYKYNICPTLSKVRNYGIDGTGVHSLKNDVSVNSYYINQPIDQAPDFELGNDIFVMQPDGIQIPKQPSSKFSVKRWVKKIILRFDIFMLRRFHIVIHSKYI